MINARGKRKNFYGCITRRDLLKSIFYGGLAVGLPFSQLSACRHHEKRKGQNIIMISMDTLRADTLGCFGYRKETSPNMDRFMSEAVFFKRAYAEEPHTLPSHVSLFTSLHAKSHGVKARLAGGIPLAKNISTLTTVLKNAGYTTAAFINGGFLHRRFGLSKGFDLYDYFSDIEKNERNKSSSHGRSASETNQAILNWIDQKSREPFFLFVHYFDIHSDWDVLPYDSPERYRQMFCKNYRGRLESAGGKKFGSTFLDAVNRNEIPLGASIIPYFKALYDAGVRYTDDRFGEFVKGLKARGLYDDSLIIILSDHGEEFMDHGKMLHTQLFNECVHVPLGIRFPGRENIGPLEINNYIQLMDVMPTVLDYIGLKPPPLLQGKSLMPLIQGILGAEEVKPIFFYTSITHKFAMIDGDWKLFFDPTTKGAGLYHLQSDPLEHRNLAAAEYVRTKEYIEKLEEWHRNIPTPYLYEDTGTVNLDNKTLELLKSLGYTR